MQNIFEKEMNRKDFFRYAGSILLGLIGVTHLIKTLSQHGLAPQGSSSNIAGYGGSAYGGPKKAKLL